MRLIDRNILSYNHSQHQIRIIILLLTFFSALIVGGTLIVSASSPYLAGFSPLSYFGEINLPTNLSLISVQVAAVVAGSCGFGLVFLFHSHTPRAIRDFLQTEMAFINAKGEPRRLCRTQVFTYPASRVEGNNVNQIRVHIKLHSFLRYHPLLFRIEIPCPPKSIRCPQKAMLLGLVFQADRNTLATTCTEGEFKWRIWQITRFLKSNQNT